MLSVGIVGMGDMVCFSDGEQTESPLTIHRDTCMPPKLTRKGFVCTCATDYPNMMK